MKRILFFLFASLTLTAGAQVQGSIGREIPDQVGVYEVRLSGEGKPLKVSDIITVSHGGQQIGEATVLSVNGSASCIVSLRGDFKVIAGDTVQYARSASQVAAGRSYRRSAPKPSPHGTRSVGSLVIERDRRAVDNSRHVHVYVDVHNRGSQRTESCTLWCRWYSRNGRNVHTDKVTVPALSPGRTITVDLHSGIHLNRRNFETMSDEIATDRDGPLAERLQITSGVSHAAPHDSQPRLRTPGPYH